MASSNVTTLVSELSSLSLLPQYCAFIESAFRVSYGCNEHLSSPSVDNPTLWPQHHYFFSSSLRQWYQGAANEGNVQDHR